MTLQGANPRSVMMAMIHPTEPIHVDCPECKAHRGERCVDGDGLMNEFHGLRLAKLHIDLTMREPNIREALKLLAD